MMGIFFGGGGNSEKIAKRFASKLCKLEYDIPERLCKRILNLEFETLDILVREHFEDFNPYVQAKLKILFDECGYIDNIFSRLESSQEETIIYNLERLGKLKLKKAYPYLVKFLADKRDSISFEAANALIKLRDERIVKHLIEELKDQKEDILPARIGQVLVGLASLAAPALIEVFEVLSREARIQAMEIFAEMKDKRAIPLLKDALQDESPIVRAQAVSALGEIGGNIIKPSLEKAAQDKELIVRENARLALKEVAASEESDDGE